MHKAVYRLARVTALVGGLVLCALIVLTCTSIIGRALNTFGHSDTLTNLSQGGADWLIGIGVGAVNGDFELLEAGIAFAIFSFLPICQIQGAHATVDVFTSLMPPRVNRALVAFWEVILAAVLVLITWRLLAGLQSKYAYGETTFLLQFPVWWAYAASFGAACVASFVGIYCAAMRVAEAFTGRLLLSTAGEGGA